MIFEGGGVGGVRPPKIDFFIKNDIYPKKIAPAALKKTSFLAFSERLPALCTKKIAPAARIYLFFAVLLSSPDPGIPRRGGGGSCNLE